MLDYEINSTAPRPSTKLNSKFSNLFRITTCYKLHMARVGIFNPAIQPDFCRNTMSKPTETDSLYSSFYKKMSDRHSLRSRHIRTLCCVYTDALAFVDEGWHLNNQTCFSFCGFCDR